MRIVKPRFARALIRSSLPTVRVRQPFQWRQDSANTAAHIDSTMAMRGPTMAEFLARPPICSRFSGGLRAKQSGRFHGHCPRHSEWFPGAQGQQQVTTLKIRAPDEIDGTQSRCYCPADINSKQISLGNFASIAFGKVESAQTDLNASQNQ